MTTGRPAEGAGWGHEGDGYGGPQPHGPDAYRPDAYGPGPIGPEPYGPGSTGHAPYGHDHDPSGAYAGQDAYLAAVGALDDPLNDPLPGGHHRQGQAVPRPAAEPHAPGAHGDPRHGPPPADAYAHPSGAHGPWLPGANGGPPGGGPDHDPATVGLRRPDGLGSRTGLPPGDDHGTFPPPAGDRAEPAPGGRAARRRAAAAGAAAATAATAAPAATGPDTTASDTAAPGGRAARRRAAAAGGAGTGPAGPAGSGPVGPDPAAGGGRAARRKAAKAAAKAAKQTGTAISNVIGELFITTGALLLLFVAYQLWWTNVEARAHANGEADRLTEQWESDGSGGADEGEDREPGVFSPGEGFAILSIPDLDVRVPIAETVNPENVLDKGMVGHYSAEDRLPTAMPWDSEGNFGIAGHRNTHAEPFRYINRLEPGDPIVVETEDTYYTYAMASRLDSTEPSNTAVLDPIPEQGGFTEPGRYITLTTCTPEFTSTYRLIVWGELVEERPRSEGKPDALVN
ncbi:class E sortase [Streptomyces marincola]|uniref:Sortase A n=1 Tax=Streptomyces marincola TaxID=2878388 RepID=A0A1W7CYI1_9ACTN|nr:class E sortase [Streptomyces marincola]ARQ69729.1 hypothetical protein CAG99_13410 [Streptomyces marincola]